ncbi:transmembrane protein, putative (macronuclear) [Tetrahymena thermophila SB210]|uniref:Transmembrane protein, putative n=1 Tax=Tetrahymena thermophila (strain SB210) TaxID=312017 RepID=Q22WS9_TETTS|nr:transmembrane protein, putative [Tetrahymena thermophila SB210]EAR89713.2 transmembrane protein, putative [Tetrahymena thermophila SB210]|eukprot:XP_001009958.2 transmembrane protein, putative [Tetrahymena thermophila SB210]
MQTNAQYIFKDLKRVIGYVYDYNEKNLYIYGSSIYVINAQLTPQKIVDKDGDYINYMTLIDRQSFDFTQFDIRVSSGVIIQLIYIEQLNYILFNTDDRQDQICIYDVSTQQQILTLSGVKQNSLDNKNIIQVQYDESSIRYVMFLDTEGTFYLSSIDPKLPFQSFVKISEFTDGQETIQKFSYDNITNDVFIYSDKQIYKFDFNLLGNQYQPILNEPQSLFVQIPINNMQNDYLIVNKYNVIQRYTEQKVKFEFALSNQNQIVEIKYNQSKDILILAFSDSILFYQQYQYNRNNNLISNIYKLDIIQFQQFITDSVVITCDSKILHLNIEKGVIIKEIQYNSTQLVTSFTFNSNQDLIIIGFSDCQLLQYNLISQEYFLYNTTQQGPLLTQIIKIQLIENLDKQQYAYAISNGALLIKIDIQKKNVISQIDLRLLANENSQIRLAHFLIDFTYQRYIFSFSGQKKAYIYNYSNNKLEQNLILPKIKIDSFTIEQGLIFIQCSFQINLFILDTKIEFLTAIKKDFITDRITSFKLITKNVIAILFLDKLELLMIKGTKFNILAQQSYGYPQFLSYKFDSQKNIVNILCLHQNGIVENNYNLDIFNKDSISGCSALISSQDNEFIQQELTYISPKQTEVITDTIIQFNRALIGGGLRIVQTDQNKLQLPLFFPFYHNVLENIAEIYGNDSASYLQNIIIKNNNQINEYLFKFYKNVINAPNNFQNEYQRYAQIQQFRSGGLIDFGIYIVDEQNRYLSFSKEKLKQGNYPEDIDFELRNLQISINQLDSNKNLINGQQIIDFNQYDSIDQTFQLNNLQILGPLKSVQYFSINSTIYRSSVNKLPVLLSIQFRKCQIGEIIQNINTLQICNQCLNGTYQLSDPQALYQQSLQEKKDINRCFNCPESAIMCQGSTIKLKNGYWRKSNTTDEIIACNSMINSCQAENPNSINYCSDGYIGPICEQCDILGDNFISYMFQEFSSKNLNTHKHVTI